MRQFPHSYRFRTRTSEVQTGPPCVFRWLFLLALVTPALDTSAQEPPSSWTNTTGKTINAEFIGLEFGVLKIRKDGKLFKVPLSKLAPKSRFQAKQRAMAQAIERKNTDARSPGLRADETISDLWDRMQRRPLDPHIVLALATHSSDITQFLTEELAPIQLTQDGLMILLTDLCSDNADTWRGAYKRLSVLNPQLAMGVEELLGLESFQEFPYRNRLVGLIAGSEIDSPYSALGLEFKKIAVRKASDGAFTLMASEPAVPGYANYSYAVKKIGEEFKSEYSAFTHALALLEHLNTPQATRLIERIASGDPRVSVTRLAQQILAQRANPVATLSVENHWNNLNFTGGFMGAHAMYESTLSIDRNLLALAKDPAATTKFLAQKLKPQTISRDELESLLTDFCSEEESRWKKAYERLRIFSPLREFSVSELLERDSFQEYPARHRLTDLLTGTPIGSDQSATLAKFEVVTLIEQAVYGEPGICMNYENPDPANDGGFGVSGSRCFPLFLGRDSDILHALRLLETFNTTEADELLKSIASGHPKMASTRQAQEILKSRQKP